MWVCGTLLAMTPWGAWGGRCCGGDKSCERMTRVARTGDSATDRGDVNSEQAAKQTPFSRCGKPGSLRHGIAATDDICVD